MMSSLQLTTQAEQFIKDHEQYRNYFGKISPYIYTISKYATELDNLLVSYQSVEEKQKLLRSYVYDGFYNLPMRAKQLKIPHDIFNYVGLKNQRKIESKVINNKSIQSAISALYMACLAGDKLNVLTSYKKY